MNVAYLILTHSMPDHFGRLIHALSDEHTDFYVHVNCRTPIEPFLAYQAPNVHFIEQRMPVYWGEWQTVEATLHLLRTALASKRKYSYLMQLSGRCYPIRSKEYIQQFLMEHSGNEFMNAVRMPNSEAHKLLSRLDRFYFRSDLSLLENCRRLALEFHSQLQFSKRLIRTWRVSRDWGRVLGSLRPYGGSGWWALTRQACRHILEFVDRQRHIVRFFENSKLPDEMFFHTILANSEFAPRMRRSLMYTDWSRGGSHPAEISEKHIEMFAQRWPMIDDGIFGKGEVCFARKFPDDGGRLAALVDDLVRRRECRYQMAGSWNN